MCFVENGLSLSEFECRELLASTSVGRVSLTIGALPVVLPVHYACSGESFVFRMNDSPAQRAVSLGKIIALGVDNAHVADMFWAVVVIGRTVEMEPLVARDELRTLGWARPTGYEQPHYVRLLPDVIEGTRTTRTV